MTTEPTDAELNTLLPIVQLNGEKPAQMVWLTRKDARAFARAVLAKWGQPAQAQADSVQEDAARWNAWASGIVEACNSDEQEPAFLVALDKAIGDAEPPVTLELLNAWTDAARKQGEKQ